MIEPGERGQTMKPIAISQLGLPLKCRKCIAKLRVAVKSWVRAGWAKPKPKCPKCGKELLLNQFYIGGVGWDIWQHCPDTAYDLCNYIVKT